MDKLSAMRTFVEIVDRGSLTAAGASLAKSLPTVVRTLAQLEEAVDARLLRRTTRRIALTPEGRVYLERCRRILADIEEAERALSDDPGELHGEIRVTAPVLFGSWHVAPAVNTFLKNHPRVTVDLLLQDAVMDLLENSVDVAVRIGALADSSMIATSVGRLRRVVCASPALLDEVGEPKRPDDLLGKPCIHLWPLTRGPRWRFREGAREREIQLDGSLTTNQPVAAAEAAAAGLGFTLLYSYQAQRLVGEGRLRVVLEAFEPEPRPVSLVYPDARLMSNRVRAFIDSTRESLSHRQEL